MTSAASLAVTASLIGDPGRATMLIALMDGRALTAGELGRAAGVAPPTASGHLARMLDAGLLALERQGRHRYYRLASASVAELVEKLMAVSGELGGIAGQVRPVVTGPSDRALRRARLCYDHLAGEIAVAIAASMSARGLLDFGEDGGAITQDGLRFLSLLDVDLGSPVQRYSLRAPFCRPCLDWSERRPHIAGLVGRALYTSFLRTGWLRGPTHGRAVQVTPPGLRALSYHFGIEPGAEDTVA